MRCTSRTIRRWLSRGIIVSVHRMIITIRMLTVIVVVVVIVIILVTVQIHLIPYLLEYPNLLRIPIGTLVLPVAEFSPCSYG